MKNLPLLLRRGVRLLSALAPVLLLAPWAARATGTNQSLPFVFHVAIAQVCFLGVNRNDAIAAYKAFLETRGRLRGETYIADPQVFDETPGLEAAIQQQPIHMAVMEAWQFLTMDVHRQMKPFFTVMVNGRVGRKYMVLTRRDSGLGTLRSLRGKSIIQTGTARANVGKCWLDTLLLSEGLEAQEKFFDSVEVVDKPTAALLPVFFGKRPACVVDEPSFQVMNELNPQLGQRLQTVAVSDAFADVVICFREDGWRSEQDKTDTIKSLNELHVDPVGQQICTLFKIDRVVPFQEAQLETTRKLRTTHASLQQEPSPAQVTATAMAGGKPGL